MSKQKALWIAIGSAASAIFFVAVFGGGCVAFWAAAISTISFGLVFWNKQNRDGRVIQFGAGDGRIQETGHVPAVRPGSTASAGSDGLFVPPGLEKRG